MNINVRWIAPFAEVSISDGNAQISLGLLNDDERLALAQMFREAIADMRLPVCIDETHTEAVT